MEVINVYKEKPGTIDYIFVGRNPEHHQNKFKFTRALPELSNPYQVGVHGAVGECVELFRKYLWRKVQAKDAKIINAILSLKDDDILGCFCLPKRCHTEVIISAYNYLKSNSQKE